MKVLLQGNVANLGKIGDMVEVKPGYARNYLLPHGLAVEPTKLNLQAIEAAKQKYLEELAKQRTELQAKADVVDGREITMSARANEEGHLYGSIGPAQIVAVLASENVFIEPEHVLLDEPIRRLDRYEVALRFGEDITAKIHVWVVPVGESEQDTEAGLHPAEPAGAADDPDPPAAPPENPTGEEA